MLRLIVHVTTGLCDIEYARLFHIGIPFDSSSSLLDHISIELLTNPVVLLSFGVGTIVVSTKLFIVYLTTGLLNVELLALLFQHCVYFGDLYNVGLIHLRVDAIL